MLTKQELLRLVNYKRGIVAGEPSVHDSLF